MNFELVFLEHGRITALEEEEEEELKRGRRMCRHWRD